MKRRATRTRTTLGGFLLALTLIAPWTLAQDPDPITETRRRAEQGDADAQFTLGVRYANGDGVIKDDEEAVRWYRLAAAQNNADAQVTLALMYVNGIGVLKDEAEAVRWYRLAAAQDNAIAQLFLGSMYVEGRGVLKDPVLAHMWLNIAGANGNENARDARDALEGDMTPAEIGRATELARTCMASDYRNCGP